MAAEAGLAGKSETVLLDGFCRRALDAGLHIARVIIIICAGRSSATCCSLRPSQTPWRNWTRGRLVSVGRYALRGVERPQELFTLDPFWTV